MHKAFILLLARVTTPLSLQTYPCKNKYDSLKKKKKQRQKRGMAGGIIHEYCVSSKTLTCHFANELLLRVDSYVF